MIYYTDLSHPVEDLFVLLMLAESYFSIYVFFRCALLRVRDPFYFRIMINMVLTVGLFLFLGSNLEEEKSHLPVPVLLLLILVIFLGAVRGQSFLKRWKERNITPMSVKEGFDSLPAGLCYYRENGPVKAVNATIEELSLALSDGDVFYEAILRADVSGEEGNGHPILIASDGRVFSVRKNRVDLDGSEVVEIIASDISEEYRLNLKLQETERLMRFRNARLKALSENIRINAMEQEALSTKVRIHDRLGHLLLLTRRFLTRPGVVDEEDILREWRLNAALLSIRKQEVWQEPYFPVKGQAEALGVKLVVTGTLPEEPHLSHVIETAITVHVTNVLRHAGGKTAWIEVTENEASFLLTFTNDGALPMTPITEGGGLLNLRREVESLGGQMVVRSKPEFLLILLLPKEVSADGLSGSYRG